MATKKIMIYTISQILNKSHNFTDTVEVEGGFKNEFKRSMKNRTLSSLKTSSEKKISGFSRNFEILNSARNSSANRLSRNLSHRF